MEFGQIPGATDERVISIKCQTIIILELLLTSFGILTTDNMGKGRISAKLEKILGIMREKQRKESWENDPLMKKIREVQNEQHERDNAHRSKIPMLRPARTGNHVEDAQAWMKWMKERPEEGPGIQRLYDSGFVKVCPGTYRNGSHVVVADGYEEPLAPDALDSAASGKKFHEDTKQSTLDSIRTKEEADAFIEQLQKKFAE